MLPHSQRMGVHPNPHLPVFVMLPFILPQCPLDHPEIISTIPSGRREAKKLEDSPSAMRLIS